MSKIGIKTIKDKDYPKLLKKIGKNAPKKIYYKGEWDDEIFKNCLAVVGSRRMTTYGRQITEKLVGQIAASGITIVSGFMYGIDATAHQAAVDAGGKTIAVLGCGINHVCPSDQTDLYNDIINNGGLIISDFEPDLKAVHWTFPLRNRIVAGLSKAVLVVEAAPKSGSLITARLAKKYDRKVLAVPGQLTGSLSRGTNDLIKKGAGMITEPEDIIKIFRIKKDNSGNVSVSPRLSGIEGKIIKELEAEPLEIDELSRRIRQPVSEIGQLLSLMQLQNLLKEENGKYYVC